MSLTLIAGGGMAGLYAALKILKRSPRARVLVVERSRHLGGRVWPIRFEGMDVAGGAGIGRLSKDRRLMRLVRELKVPHRIFRHRVNYAGTHRRSLLASRKKVAEWQRKLEAARPSLLAATMERRPSFRQFAISVLGARDARRMVEVLGFGDDQEADALDTLDRYGLEDNYDLGKGVSIPWRKLVNSMANKIRSYPNATIRLGVGLHKFEVIQGDAALSPGRSRRRPCSFVATLRGSSSSSSSPLPPLPCSRIILALPAHATAAILSRVSKGMGTSTTAVSRLIRSNVKSQSFMLAYARLEKEDAARLSARVPYYTVTGGVMQKILPMDAKRGVFMVAYADNANAKRIHALRSCRALMRLVSHRLGYETPLRSTSCRFRFIRHGTHYYTPGTWQNRQRFVSTLHNLLPRNVHLVGEAFSLHQGWVEGALQSVSDAKF